MAAHEDEVDWGVEEEEFDMWATGDGGQQEGNDADGQDVKGEMKAEHAAIKAEKPSEAPNGTSELPLVLTIHSRSHPGRLYYHLPATGETTWYAPSSPVRMLDMSGMKTPPIPLSERLGLGPSVGMKSELKRVGAMSSPSASASEAAGLFEEDEAEKTKVEPVKSGKEGIPLAQRIGPMVTSARESKSATPAAGATDVARDERAASAGSVQRSGSTVPTHPEQQDIKPIIKEAGRERSRERPSRFGPEVDERTAGEHVRAAAVVDPPRANGQTHSQLSELEDRKPVISPPATSQRPRSPPHGPRSAGISTSTASRDAPLDPVPGSGSTGISTATPTAPDARPARWSIKREPEDLYRMDRRRSPPASSAAQQPAASRPRPENCSSCAYLGRKSCIGAAQWRRAMAGCAA